jgi:glyoxalase family protein
MATQIPPALAGIHHVTAITSDAQKNIDFYCGVLGLRLVKLTVNFDDPSSYHLYYGDELGRPGSILTFFAWPGAHRGPIGPPQVTETAFSVPVAALGFWRERLSRSGIELTPSPARFGQELLTFADFDGMRLAIVGTDEPAGQPWAAGPVPADKAICGFHGITISEEGYQATANVLAELMGFKAAGHEGNRFRYQAGAGNALASIVDLICVPDARHGGMGAGAVHHVAFRIPDDPQQEQWRRELVARRFNVSPVMDRSYFHSIYFREPGGVLFEIATDVPGFTADEPAERLGTRLMLPPQLEPYRDQIERAVPPIRLPGASSSAR